MGGRLSEERRGVEDELSRSEVRRRRRMSWLAYAHSSRIGAARLLPVLITVLTFTGAAVAGATNAAHVTVRSPTGLIAMDYFALGDSIASGHGLQNGGAPGTTCRRSKRAYPNKVRARLAKRFGKVRFRFRACTGASATRFHADPRRSLRTQVDFVLANLSERPTLVSITAGVNDLEWTDIESTLPRLYVDSKSSYRFWVRTKVADVRAALEAETDRLLEHPNVVVVLTEYHNPFNRESVFFLGSGALCAGGGCYRRTEFAEHRLNRATRRIVATSERGSRLRLARVHRRFHGHEAPRFSCGTSSPSVSTTWVQYLNDPQSESFPLVVRPWLRLLGLWRGDCFHPNETGAKQYAKAVVAVAVPPLRRLIAAPYPAPADDGTGRHHLSSWIHR